MNRLRELTLSYGYMGKGESVLSSFTLPCLKSCTSYDRVTSYYSFSSLLAIAEGIQSLYEQDGQMRLVLGVHSVPQEILDASLKRAHLSAEIELVRESIAQGVRCISDSLQKKNVATLAWMMEDGLLEVRAAAMEGEGIFHPKTLIFKDDVDDRVVAVGSSNETGSGHGSNFEQLMVAWSWESEGAVVLQEEFFESLWQNERDDAIVGDITEDIAATILGSLGEEYRNPKKKTLEGASNVLETASCMPANFFVSGQIPALYQHQERAVLDALSRWPVRVLFADEVGLGKTFEVAATLAFLIRYCGVERALILTPKAVLQQWQDELSEHFGIDAWLYDSVAKQYVNPEGKTIKIGSSNPIGKKAPGVMLMSAQYARGSGKQKNVFERSGAIYPDVLVLDEAHSARVSKDLSGKKKTTKIYSMLSQHATRIPHVILATATPMQKDADEYHSTLSLLGLPPSWSKSRPYQTSLKLIADAESPTTSDAYTAGKLLRSTMAGIKPSLRDLTQAESDALTGLLELGPDADNLDIAEYVLSKWSTLKPVFVKLHPAHLLTVRNTRESLAKIGYVFPKRNLHAETIADSTDVQLFYMNVEQYIDSQYFMVECALHPDKKMNVGFVRVSYQQRLASSLYSCKESLERRFAKLREMKEALEIGVVEKSMYAYLDEVSGFDVFTYDDAFLDGDESIEVASSGISDSSDPGELHRALCIETTSLATLIAQVDRLLENRGDLKVSRSIQLALNHLANGDRVLVFSRYTDTVEALVKLFKEADKYEHPFGIYVGQRSVRVDSGGEHPVTKSEIKRGLETGDIPIMFCSDAASEGLNLQAARILINVDVPWTPARLEQRIGRVARLGQKAAEVEVYNVWYPNSVEAKMYTRINKRLQEMNLAVGEFPQVVSDAIRDSILSGNDDDGLYELQQIRDSMQARALSVLWSSQDDGKTTSRYVRDSLMQLCDENLTEMSASGVVSEYQNARGGRVALCPEEGRPESVSYLSLVSAGVDFDIADLTVLDDENGNPCAFALRSDRSKLLPHESLAKLLLGDSPSVISKDVVPKTLPDSNNRSFAFAMDCSIPSRPAFWPPAS